MELSFPKEIRRAADAVRFVCDKLSAQSVRNYIHTEHDFVTVNIQGISCAVEVDFAKRVVIFEPINTEGDLCL